MRKNKYKSSLYKGKHARADMIAIWGTADRKCDNPQFILSLLRIRDDPQPLSIMCQVYSVLCCLCYDSKPAKDYIFLLLYT